MIWVVPMKFLLFITVIGINFWFRQGKQKKKGYSLKKKLTLMKLRIEGIHMALSFHLQFTYKVENFFDEKLSKVISPSLSPQTPPHTLPLPYLRFSKARSLYQLITIKNCKHFKKFLPLPNKNDCFL